MAKPSHYNGIDAHDRETFLNNVFEMGSIGSADRTIRRCRLPGTVPD